jgi:hypothetical protein
VIIFINALSLSVSQIAGDPLLLIGSLVGAGAAVALVLLGVTAVIDSARKRVCPCCKRAAQPGGEDLWI